MSYGPSLDNTGDLAASILCSLFQAPAVSTSEVGLSLAFGFRATEYILGLDNFPHPVKLTVQRMRMLAPPG